MAEKGSVTSKIVRHLCKNIENGVWIVGDKISSENQLCKELGVSRVSVRSAIQQFNALGIMQSVHGKGTFLISDDLSIFALETAGKIENKESIQSMRYMLEFRGMIEPDICGKAAANATPELVAQLEKLLDTMRNSVGKNESFVEADMDFHLEICRTSDNPFIIKVMSDIFRKRTDLGQMLNLANGYYGGIYYHGLLLDAFKKRDGKKARALMAEHLQRGIDDLVADNAEDTEDAEEGERE